ncbi:unnamed protein product, partial [Mesorhabditis spiculigera]
MLQKLILILICVLAYGWEEVYDDDGANSTCPFLQGELDAQDIPGFNWTDGALLQTTRTCHDELLSDLQKQKEEIADLKSKLENATSEAHRYKADAEDWKSLLDIELNKTAAREEIELDKGERNNTSILWHGWSWIPSHNDTPGLVGTLAARVGAGFACDWLSDILEAPQPPPVHGFYVKLLKLVLLLLWVALDVHYGFTGLRVICGLLWVTVIYELAQLTTSPSQRHLVGVTRFQIDETLVLLIVWVLLASTLLAALIRRCSLLLLPTIIIQGAGLTWSLLLFVAFLVIGSFGKVKPLAAALIFADHMAWERVVSLAGSIVLLALQLFFLTGSYRYYRARAIWIQKNGRSINRARRYPAGTKSLSTSSCRLSHSLDTVIMPKKNNANRCLSQV